MASPAFPTLEQLRKNPTVSVFHGVRVVHCDLTGQPLTSYAAIPVPKVGKNGKSKTSFRGSFVDYETAMGYLKSLHQRALLSIEDFDTIRAAVVAHLGFMPKFPEADASLLAPFGPLTLASWHNSYTPESLTHHGALFSIPEKKAEKEHKDKYLAYHALEDGGKFRIDTSNIAFTANRFEPLLKPWGDDPALAYTLLVTMSGERPNPEQVIIQEYPGPKQHTDLLGLKSAKINGKKVTVLKSQKEPKAARAADIVAQIDAAMEEVVKQPKGSRKAGASANKKAAADADVAAAVVATAVSKKRKTVAA